MVNPSLYEINTRVWLRRFDTETKTATLSDVPLVYWTELAQKGINYIWLMGIWEPCRNSIKKYCFSKGLINEYRLALPDWKDEDVIGSPFAINKYEVNGKIGSKSELLDLKSTLNRLGLKLILDFIPNHFNSESVLLKTCPELFLQATEKHYKNDKSTYFRDPFDRDIYFAHGRDPYFPAWTDTAQVNYFNEAARNFMTTSLVDLTAMCDGVRCDVAMLMLNDIFAATWSDVLKFHNLDIPANEFWDKAIDAVKQVDNDFIFIAEVYWDLEWRLQKLGFDFTYDKKLTDRLKVENAHNIREHLLADYEYQNKSVRFLENHDEDRIIHSVGNAKSKAAAVVTSTLKGMRFYHDGQFEGKRVKLPVQLGREPHEEVNHGTLRFYEKLLNITNSEVFIKGEWKLLQALPSGQSDQSYKNILAWEWSFEKTLCVVIVNYSDNISYCRLRINFHTDSKELLIHDLLNDETYNRSADELTSVGLFVKLAPYLSHILECNF